MRAEILCIGTELLLGQIVDTNSAYIGRKLAEIGVDVFHKATVGDNKERAASAIRDALARADVVIITGGLGPTEDDLTREAVAEAMGLPMRVYPEAREPVEFMLRGTGHGTPVGVLRQSVIPEGARLIRNDLGTASGLIIEDGARAVICMPGVPAEMRGMMESTVIPYLRDKAEGARSVIRSRVLKVCGPGEASVEDAVRDLLHGQTNPTVAPLVSLSEVALRITAKASSSEEADAMIAVVESKIRERLGDDIYGADDDELQHAVVRLLMEKKLSLAVAESVTGGLIAHKLTEVPGCSATLGLAATTYSNDAKCKVLGIPGSTIRSFGAVSREVAIAMATGVLLLAGADVAVSTTGIAGPAGGSAARSVGLVFVGVAWRGGVASARLMLFGTRSEIKERAAKRALDLLRRHVLRRW
ncbi:MAG: competence/damage-inducible protein A [Bacillota bacterium]